MNNNELWSAIYSLHYLLVNKINLEKYYQELFERHSIIFSVLNLYNPKSFEKSSEYCLPYDKERDFTPEPDFIAHKKHSSTLTIVELKTPFIKQSTTARKDGNRCKFTAAVSSFRSQATEYSQTIKERESARDYLKGLFSLEKISDVDVILIAGLESENKTYEVEKLLSEYKTPTQIVYFDTLMNMLLNKYHESANTPVGKRGLTATYVISLDSIQNHGKNVISEAKSQSGDSLTFEYEDGSVSLIFKDSSGKINYLQSAVKTDEFFYLKLEFCNDEDGFFMSLDVDNHIQDLRISKYQFNFNYDNDQFAVGAKLDGSQGAVFTLKTYAFWGEITQYESKLNYFLKCKKLIENDDKAIRFESQHFMFKDSKGMYQPDKLKQPTFIQLP
ncbi:hypothetical protein PQO01_15295 [Lentisphaera marina]|uniref:Shedu anti-phage system protein SduA domain-containing protein n=1 Tax=Lentisphaera marina TaxID=1111041 RepID=UPI0023662690|nr:Shedu anti-phage system protein SduA domain-containing protein [Lentisphaera marina]MDD7986315.1 hypothetical protein [Lentisphaera marina]